MINPRSPEPKELFVINELTHVDLYDHVDGSGPKRMEILAKPFLKKAKLCSKRSEFRQNEVTYEPHVSRRILLEHDLATTRRDPTVSV